MPTLEEQAHVTYPKWVSKDQRTIIESAQMVGWVLHVSPTRMQMKLVSPGGEKTIMYDNRHPAHRQRDAKTVVKYADPLKVELAIASVEVGNHLPREVQDAILADLTADGDSKVVHEEKPEPKADPIEGYVDVPDEVLEPESSTTLVEPVIVSENFMLAKAGDDRGYRSEHTIERHWSDGSTDYKCARCDFTATGRKSVPAHQQVHVKAGEGKAAAPQPFKAEVPDAVSYRPRQSRVDALAAHLEDCMAGGALDAQSIAREALNWQHEQAKKGTEHADYAEMSAEDMLDRIRRMVASDAISGYEQRLAEVEENLRYMNGAHADAVTRAEQAEERARKAEETLESFAELAASLRSKHGPDVR